MADHSPAPWSVGTAGSIIDANGDPIGEADTNLGTIPLPVRDATARLFAAAPELLAACAGFLAHMDGSDLTELGAILYAMRAAVARARGDCRG